MRIVIVTGVLITIFLLFLSTGCVNEIPGADNQAGDVWNGTWESHLYTIFIRQDGTKISGKYEPKDPRSYDPGLFEGTVSGDGTVFSGKWIESGHFTYTMAYDGMSYSGTTGRRLDRELLDYELIPKNRTRIGTQFDPENIWNGTWQGATTIHTYIQTGNKVREEIYLPSSDTDEPGTSEGTVSEDGKTLTGTWLETGNYSFTLSDDGSFFNGTYGIDLDDSLDTYSWNATKLS